MKIKISPSILSANFGHLQKDVDLVKTADWLHVDVMDGHFVPNITIGPVVLKDIKTGLFIDVHLMIENPENYVEEFIKAGAQNITIHAETCGKKMGEILDKIHSLGSKASVSLNPDSELDLIEDVLDKVDMVLLMTVFPGFAGQKFIVDVMSKVKKLHEMKPDLDIEVDGGIDGTTSKLAIEAGANVLVSGSYIFGSNDPVKTIELLRG